MKRRFFSVRINILKKEEREKIIINTDLADEIDQSGKKSIIKIYIYYFDELVELFMGSVKIFYLEFHFRA
jgi:hypothetical protein